MNKLWLSRILILATLCPATLAQFNGSVYTTDRHAGVENIFKTKNKVFMAGGPGPNAGCSGNGLPDGTFRLVFTEGIVGVWKVVEALELEMIRE